MSLVDPLESVLRSAHRRRYRSERIEARTALLAVTVMIEHELGVGAFVKKALPFAAVQLGLATLYLRLFLS